MSTLSVSPSLIVRTLAFQKKHFGPPLPGPRHGARYLACACGAASATSATTAVVSARRRRMRLLDHDLLTHLHRMHEAVDGELPLLRELVLEAALLLLAARAPLAVQLGDGVLVLGAPGPLHGRALLDRELALREEVVLQRRRLGRRRHCRDSEKSSDEGGEGQELAHG